jgi:hypothetical protein
MCPHTTIYASSYCRDATLVLEAFLFDSTPLTHQVMTKLCSSLITVPPRVRLMKRHTEMSEIFEKCLLPQATDARSFGHEVTAITKPLLNHYSPLTKLNHYSPPTKPLVTARATTPGRPDIHCQPPVARLLVPAMCVLMLLSMCPHTTTYVPALYLGYREAAVARLLVSAFSAQQHNRRQRQRGHPAD